MNDEPHPTRWLRLFGLLTLVAAACNETGPVANNRGPWAFPATPSGLIRTPTLTPAATVITAVAPGLVVAYADSQQIAWKVQLPPGEELVAPPGVAADSSTYLLTNRQVRGVDPDGKLTFATPFPFTPRRGQRPSRYGLAVMPDSAAVVTDGERRVARVARDGVISWRYELPAPATMSAPPVAGPNGSIYLRTASSLFSLSSEGHYRWRIPLRVF